MARCNQVLTTPALRAILTFGYSPDNCMRRSKIGTQSKIRAQRKQRAAQMLAQLRRTIPSVLAGYPVDAAYVYGSVARGSDHLLDQSVPPHFTKGRHQICSPPDIAVPVCV